MADATEISRIRTIRRRMSNLLLGWSVGSILVGLFVYWIASRQDSPSQKFGEAVAAQFVIWGAIDLVFAVMGVLQATRAAGTPIDAIAIQREAAECHKLRGTLRFNRGLNWIWVACGVVLVSAGLGAMWRNALPVTVASLFGHGLGVIVQGGFLFWFDRAFLHRLDAAQT